MNPFLKNAGFGETIYDTVHDPDTSGLVQNAILPATLLGMGGVGALSMRNKLVQRGDTAEAALAHRNAINKLIVANRNQALAAANQQSSAAQSQLAQANALIAQLQKRKRTPKVVPPVAGAAGPGFTMPEWLKNLSANVAKAPGWQKGLGVAGLGAASLYGAHELMAPPPPPPKPEGGLSDDMLYGLTGAGIGGLGGMMLGNAVNPEQANMYALLGAGAGAGAGYYGRPYIQPQLSKLMGSLNPQAKTSDIAAEYINNMIMQKEAGLGDMINKGVKAVSNWGTNLAKKPVGQALADNKLPLGIAGGAVGGAGLHAAFSGNSNPPQQQPQQQQGYPQTRYADLANLYIQNLIMQKKASLDTYLNKPSADSQTENTDDGMNKLQKFVDEYDQGRDIAATRGAESLKKEQGESVGRKLNERERAKELDKLHRYIPKVSGESSKFASLKELAKSLI